MSGEKKNKKHVCVKAVCEECGNRIDLTHLLMNHHNAKLLVLKKEIMNKLKSFEETELLHRYDVEKIIDGVFK